MTISKSNPVLKNTSVAADKELLLERNNHLGELTNRFQNVKEGIGHTLFLTGEAGIGKTSLINHFVKGVENESVILTGGCDSLFTPRPLGPLYDISAQIGKDFVDLLKNETDRSLIFATLVQKLSSSDKPVVLVFEDIHWADEATIDLIKFLARRIHRHRCLFLLTYRDDEIHSRHPLITIFGELSSGYFSKIAIERFSKETVDQLAAAKGYASGDKLYALTGGNPFYVTEILASYSLGIPERIKDSILAVFYSRDDTTKALWEFLSVLPTSRIEHSIAKQIDNDFANCIDACIAGGVIVSRPGHLSFKHELYRLTIEESLSHSKRRNLHKKMLRIMQKELTDSGNLSQLVHHARYAEEKELVAELAPKAAEQAAAMGAHMEASKFYQTAIEYTSKNDFHIAELYEHYAYECYLTNQLTEAIQSQQYALELWRNKKVRLKEGNALRLLSRFLWFQGRCDEVMALAYESVEVLENGFPTRERALAYSNLAQLYMLADNMKKTLYWGHKAIDLAVKMEDQEVLSHALNNVGTVQLKFSSTEAEGEEKLKESLSIALRNNLHEHVARAYTNLSTMFVLSKYYDKAVTAFDTGLKYCEAFDLNSWTYYMLSEKVKLLLDKGAWQEAEDVATPLHGNLFHNAIVRIGAIIVLARLKVRKGEFDEARTLIAEGKELAAPTGEAHRIIPLLTAELELCWINKEPLPLQELVEAENTLFYERDHSWYYSDLAYWMQKCGIQKEEVSGIEFTTPYRLESEGNWRDAATWWNESGCPYEEALALSNGDEEHQKQALLILNKLGAVAVHEKLKSELKIKGVRNIPRGPRESTRSNPAQLTNRQIDVLLLLKEGLQNTEIADKLFISPKTVDHHISAILSQLEVNSRTKAVVEAEKLGILK